jgi:hypothetical protein
LNILAAGCSLLGIDFLLSARSKKPEAESI